MKRNHPEAGAALIIALLVLVILSVLAASIIFVTQTETWAAANNRSMVQARYAAEAGAQKALNWLRYTYTPPSSMAAFNQTKYPIQLAGGGDVILSAMTGVTGTYPDATVQTAFSTALKDASVPGVGVPASYEVTAKLISSTAGSGVSWLGSGGGGGAFQTWQITSQGNVPGIRNAQVQVVMTVERTGTPIFKYAVEALHTGCPALTFGGNDGTDSYNSSVGPYSITNSQPSGGNIASNGGVNLGSGANIKGTVSDVSTTVGACPGITGSGTYSGTNKLTAKLPTQLPWGCSGLPCYPSPLPPTTTQSISTSTCASIPGCTSNGTTTLLDNGSSTTANVFTLTPGNYGNLTISNADVVHLTAGTYDINSLNFAKDGQIVVDSGPVILNVAGQGFAAGSTVINSGGLSGWNLCAGGVTGNPGQYPSGTSHDASCGDPAKAPISGIPGNLQIVYAGPATIAATGAPLVSAIYAPNAFVDSTGAAVGMYGSIVCGSFNEGSKAPVHYDSELANLMVAGPYSPISFTWSKF